MDKHTASQILYTFTTPKLVEVLELYANERIEVLQRVLESSNDLNEIKQAQGAIKELRRLLTLREDAAKVVEVNRHG